MNVRFVSHASFSVESEGTTLLTDPWLVGKAFNNGWSLLSPSASVPLEKVDYFWISHQHPDHLNFPTIKSIPQQERGRIAVLYQKHASPRIPKVLIGLGYTNVHELPLHRWVRLRNGVEVMCGSVGSMDSWLAVRAEDECILNLNDCLLTRRHMRQVRDLVGGPISLLFTQFSFANWIGNYSDDRREAERKILDLQFRREFFKPEATVPFASFIYFCNRENSWMNKFAVTPRRIEEMQLPGVHFMYPGDKWDSAVRHFNSAEAVRRYMSDLQTLSIDPTPPSVSPDTITDAVTRMLRMLHSRFGRLLIGRIAPFNVYVHDIDKIAKISLGNSSCNVVDATEESRRNARYVMCSQVLWFTFSYSWGWGAMEVSGMFLDREYSTKRENPIAFYLNLLSSECLDCRGFAQTLRTLGFLWSKRGEVSEGVLNKVGDMICTLARTGPAAQPLELEVSQNRDAVSGDPRETQVPDSARDSYQTHQ
jgi:UDP-MurNAc hydroxylase